MRVDERLATAFPHESDPVVRVDLARGLHNLALHRAEAGDLSGAINAGQLLWARHGEDSDPEIRDAVARGQRNLAIDQAADQDLPGAIETGQRLVDRFGADQTPGVRAAVSGAMVNLADHLAQCGRLPEAIAAGNASSPCSVRTPRPPSSSPSNGVEPIWKAAVCNRIPKARKPFRNSSEARPLVAGLGDRPTR